jgi:transcriptional regulator with XRE-family HTH domain
MFESHVNYGSRPANYACVMETMGDRIRQLRNSRRWTQADLADQLDLTAAAVSSWEKGVTKDLKIENFLRFCEVFDCDPLWLEFGEAGAPWGKTPQGKAGKT